MGDKKTLIDAKGLLNRLKNQKAVDKAEIQGLKTQLASLSASHQDEAHEKLSLVKAEKAQNAEIIKKLQDRLNRTVIRSPARGLVKGLEINTIGAVIQPGQIIMNIIPLDTALEVAVKISPKDIGHIKVGQKVNVKLSTYDFSRYGFVKGHLDHISASTFSNQGNDRYYQGRIVLDNIYVGKNKNNMIMPGMTAMADIITGQKTILNYLLKPIHSSLKSSFTER